MDNHASEIQRQKSPPRYKSQTVSQPNDIGDPKLHPLFLLLESNPNGQRAFLSLCARQRDNAGRTNPNGLKLPALTETMSSEVMMRHKGAPEEAYARPDGFFALGRSFFPDGKTIGADMKRYAAKNISTTSTNHTQDEDDMVEFMTALRKIVGNRVTSKLELEFLNLIQKTPIKVPGKEISTLKHLSQQWKSEVPCHDLAEGAYLLFVKGICSTRRNMLCWEILSSLKVWLTVQNEDDVVNRGIKTNAPKRHFVHDLIATKIRENFRKKYCSGQHNITLTQSCNHDPAAKLMFVWHVHVTGWETAKHIRWKDDQETKKLSVEPAPTKVLAQIEMGQSNNEVKAEEEEALQVLSAIATGQPDPVLKPGDDCSFDFNFSKVDWDTFPNDPAHPINPADPLLLGTPAGNRHETAAKMAGLPQMSSDHIAVVRCPLADLADAAEQVAKAQLAGPAVNTANSVTLGHPSHGLQNIQVGKLQPPQHPLHQYPKPPKHPPQQYPKDDAKLLAMKAKKDQADQDKAQAALRKKENAKKKADAMAAKKQSTTKRRAAPEGPAELLRAAPEDPAELLRAQLAKLTAEKEQVTAENEELKRTQKFLVGEAVKENMVTPEDAEAKAKALTSEAAESMKKKKAVTSVVKKVVATVVKKKAAAATKQSAKKKSFASAPSGCHDPVEVLGHRKWRGIMQVRVRYETLVQYRTVYEDGSPWIDLGPAYYDLDTADEDNVLAVYCVWAADELLKEALIKAVFGLTAEQLTEIDVPKGGVFSPDLVDRAMKAKPKENDCEVEEKESVDDPTCGKCDRNHQDPSHYEKTIWPQYFEPNTVKAKYGPANCRECVKEKVEDPSIQWEGPMRVRENRPCFTCKYIALNRTGQCFAEAFLCFTHHDKLNMDYSPDRAPGNNMTSRRKRKRPELSGVKQSL